MLTADGMLTVVNGAQINALTGGEGDAGQLTVSAKELLVKGLGGAGQPSGLFSQANTESSGNAGTVTVTVDGLLHLLDGGLISSITFAEGNAGDVEVQAGELRIDGQGQASQTTGIVSTAQSNSLGNGGTVRVKVDGALELVNRAAIGASTFSVGNAGNVEVRAADIRIDGQGTGDRTGIFSRAGAEGFDADGFVGNVSIETDALTLVDGGQISIEATPTVPEDRLGGVPKTSVHITTNRLQLEQGGRITAESTGNVPASAVEIHAGDLLIESESRITTESNEADGGPIRIIGRNNVVVRDSLITTSVEGLTGDGGNINVNANALILQGGFIQANTAAQKARGGDVFIDTKTLIASHDLLQVGGTERLTFQPGSGRNVIQAAAPGGEQGMITITSPDLDISGALLTLSTPFVEAARLVSDPCTVAAGEAANSLIPRGRGGVPAGPEQPQAVFFGGERLDRLLDTEIGSPVTIPRTGGESPLNTTLTDCQRAR